MVDMPKHGRDFDVGRENNDILIGIATLFQRYAADPRRVKHKHGIPTKPTPDKKHGVPDITKYLVDNAYHLNSAFAECKRNKLCNKCGETWRRGHKCAEVAIKNYVFRRMAYHASTSTSSMTAKKEAKETPQQLLRFQENSANDSSTQEKDSLTLLLQAMLEGQDQEIKPQDFS